MIWDVVKASVYQAQERVGRKRFSSFGGQRSPWAALSCKESIIHVHGLFLHPQLRQGNRGVAWATGLCGSPGIAARIRIPSCDQAVWRGILTERHVPDPPIMLFARHGASVATTESASRSRRRERYITNGVSLLHTRQL